MSGIVKRWTAAEASNLSDRELSEAVRAVGVKPSGGRAGMVRQLIDAQRLAGPQVESAKSDDADGGVGERPAPDSWSADGERDAYRLREIAKRLGVCVRTIRRWIDCGRFPKPVILGNDTFILAKDYRAYLDSKQRG